MKFRVCGEKSDFWLVFGSLWLLSVFCVYLVEWMKNNPLGAK